MAARKTKSTRNECSELIEALNAIEKEKQISKEVILEAVENSLLAACKNQFFCKYFYFTSFTVNVYFYIF